MTGSDGAGGAGTDDGVDVDEDLDELHPVSTSLRTAQEQEGGVDRPVDAGDGQAESMQSDADAPESDREGLDELHPVSSSIRTVQSQPDTGDADEGDDGDVGASDEESGGDD